MAMAGAAVAGPAPQRHHTASARGVVAGSITSLSSSVLKVKSSSGKRLLLSVGASRAATGSATARVTLSTSGRVSESHTWTFPMKASGFSSKSRQAKLVTGHALGSFGKIALTFNTRSQHTKRCHPAGQLTTALGSLTGTVFFNTNTGKRWGSVGSRTHKLSFKTPNSLTTFKSGCPVGQGTTPPCVRGLFWSAPYNVASHASFSGSVFRRSGHPSATVSVFASLVLAKPAGAQRTDSLTANEPVPKQTKTGLSITTSGRTITGSAKIQATGTTSNNYGCKAGHKKHTEKTKTYSGTWTGKKFMAHFSATGKLSAPNTGFASFTTESF
jgi:hypothetical protein